MQFKELKIREVCEDDCFSIFEWRNDKHSQKMSFNSDYINYEEHFKWFTSSLKNKKKKHYIGIINDQKIGYCSFEIDENILKSKVSINLNPTYRGKGFGKKFLEKSMDEYLALNEFDLIAYLKLENLVSKKVFESVGFEFKSLNEEILILQKKITKLNFRKIINSDIESLFELLKKRKFHISHNSLPSFKEHKYFVENHPYRYWYIIYESTKVIGSFYLQYDNSIGLDISVPSKRIVTRTIKYIKKYFKPIKEVKSKIPPYFYLNIPYYDEDMLEIIINLVNCKPIQTSFMIK